ncbi:MAG: hypothetical protein M3Z83_10105 [Actinomycetota bacterium]|nr:hypothetical protein [Actinomycetota bacterium]
MTASQAASAPSSDLARPLGATPARITVLLYSDDVATRDAVRLAVGRRPARDVEVTAWREVATPAAAVSATEAGGVDVIVLDGEAAKMGGLGLCKQLKNEIFDCPPVIVLTGRPQDAWLAAWSQAELAVPHPIDPVAMSRAVAELGRRVAATSA